MEEQNRWRCDLRLSVASNSQFILSDDNQIDYKHGFDVTVSLLYIQTKLQDIIHRLLRDSKEGFIIRAPKDVAVVWYFSEERYRMGCCSSLVIPYWLFSSQGKAMVCLSLKQKWGSLNLLSFYQLPNPMMFLSCLSVNKTPNTLLRMRLSRLTCSNCSWTIDLSIQWSFSIWKIYFDATLYFLLNSVSSYFIYRTSSQRFLQFFYMKLSFCSRISRSFLYCQGKIDGLEMNCYYNFLIFVINYLFQSYASLAIRLFYSISQSNTGLSYFCMFFSQPLSRCIQDSYYLSKASFGSRFMIGTFVTYLALEAYLRVETVSSQFEMHAETVAIITVLALPPSESWSRRVNLESLYGMKPPLPQTKQEITFPKAVRDKLILVAYKNLSPTEPLLVCLSEPAKSIRLNLEPISFQMFSFFSKDSTQMVKIEWEREDSEFINVSPVVLLLFPILRQLMISAEEVTGIFLRSLIKIPCSGDYRNYSLVFQQGCSKSRSYSLYSQTCEHIMRKSLDLSF